MKSALCLLSGKSCARLIEMFIRQIYRDEKGGREAHSIERLGELQQARQTLSPRSFQTRPGEEVLEQVCGARYCSASREGERKEG